MVIIMKKLAHLLTDKFKIILIVLILMNSCDYNENKQESKRKSKIITWSIFNIVEDKKMFIGKLLQFVDEKKVTITLKDNLIEDPGYPIKTKVLKKLKHDLFDFLFVIDTSKYSNRPIYLKDTTYLFSRNNPYMNYLYLGKLHNIIVSVNLSHTINIDNQIGVYEFMFSEDGLLFVLNDVSYIDKKQNKLINEFVNSIINCDTCKFNFDSLYNQIKK